MISVAVLISYTLQAFGKNPADNPEGSRYQLGFILFNLGRIGNTAKALLPLLLFFIRAQDPHLQKYLMKSFKLLKNTRAIPFLRRLTAGVTGRDTSEKFEQFDQEGFTEEMMMEQDDADEANWMNMLPGIIKETLTRTFLASITVYYPNLLRSLMNSKEMTTFQDSNDARMYPIKGDEMMSLLGTQNSISDCQMTVYAPRIFKDILVSNMKVVNFEESLDIACNAENIKKAGEGNGGASGELFMFSHDCRLIIKTITGEEHKSFEKFVYEYSNHLQYNRLSQIAKVYGLFEFKFQGTNKSVRLIVMENLFTLGNECILKKYDVKGSQHSRQVLTEYTDITRMSKYDKVLKDLDFLEIEKEIRLPTGAHAKRLEISKTIRADVNFFHTHKIIDYSMIIGVIDLRLCNQARFKSEYSQCHNHFIQSSDPNILFIVGIIDYFQQYTWVKAFERCAKRTRKCNPKLDTSSQPPGYYSTRFFEFASKIIK